MALTLAQVSFIVTGYVTHLVLARVLGPAGYGTYGVTLSVLSTVALILNGGLPEAIAKFAAERPADTQAIFARGIAIQFRLSLVLALAFALLSPVIGYALKDRALTPVLAACALAVPPIALYAVVVGAFNGQRRFVAQALTVTSYGVLRAAIVVGLAAKFELAGAVAGFIAAPLIVVAVALPGILRPKTASTLGTRELWVFARPVIAFSIAHALLMGLDLFFVKAIVRNPDEIGYYAAAATIAKVPYFFFSTLGVVLLPIVSSAGNDSSGTVMPTVRQAIRLISALALGVAAVVAPLARPTMIVLYGQPYSMAALPLGLLVLAGTAFTLTFIVAHTLSGLGHPSIAMRLTLAGLVLEVVLVATLTPLFGTVGAAGASAAVSLVLFFAVVHFAHPLLGTLFGLRSWLRIALALLLTTLLGYALPHSKALHLLWSVPLAMVYLGGLVVRGEFTFADIRRWVRREPAASSAT
ncbi:MAG: oligosaccharide flippase family protein [Polyangiaceae bacterium]